jgi:hypothetical protein
MADLVFNSFKRDIMNGTLDLDTQDIKVMLVTSAYTPDIDAHEFIDDVTNEVVGTGYTAGGQSLATKTVVVDDTNDRGVFDAADPSWTTATITARGAVLYYDSGVPATSPLIGYWDFGSDQVSTAGTFTININVIGILTLT